ncbi:hypothetical protein [Marinobacter sediminicola]|uniref:hypothetical protein n=1 Tax=Marinobacter sediminicola TaxID=3072994 RepID=UPI002811DA9F|nr:hypothetical protein [Marinobacter sp. F26243]
MPDHTAKEEQFSQLEDVLQSPVVMLQLADSAATTLKVRQLLQASKRCCIITNTSTSNRKLKNIKTLYHSLATLNKLQQDFSHEDPLTNANLVGIYPSLDYPACVYELNTSADLYVSANILPYDHSNLARMIRNVVAKLLGANPAIGGLGLILSRE